MTSLLSSYSYLFHQVTLATAYVMGTCPRFYPWIHRLMSNLVHGVQKGTLMVLSVDAPLETTNRNLACSLVCNIITLIPKRFLEMLLEAYERIS